MPENGRAPSFVSWIFGACWIPRGVIYLAIPSNQGMGVVEQGQVGRKKWSVSVMIIEQLDKILSSYICNHFHAQESSGFDKSVDKRLSMSWS